MRIDIHTHILPCLDDGADDMDMSLEMLQIAGEDGIGCVIATPHYIAGSFECDKSLVEAKCRELSNQASSRGLESIILPGAEAFICPDLLSLVENGVIRTLNNSCYILVELPMMSIPAYTDDVLYRLKLNGFNPIIAHPERNREILNNPNIVYDLVQRGVLIQINATSLTGLSGGKVRQTALTLLRHGLVHYVASDAHACGGRSPRLAAAAEIVAAECGGQTAVELFETNCQAVVDNRIFNMPEAERIGHGRNSRTHLLFGLRN